MKKLFFLVIAGIVMSACSISGNKTQSPQGGRNEVVITDDLENAMGKVPGWINENTVIAMKEPKAPRVKILSILMI